MGSASAGGSVEGLPWLVLERQGSGLYLWSVLWLVWWPILGYTGRLWGWAGWETLQIAATITKQPVGWPAKEARTLAARQLWKRQLNSSTEWLGEKRGWGSRSTEEGELRLRVDKKKESVEKHICTWLLVESRRAVKPLGSRISDTWPQGGSCNSGWC